MSRAWSARLTMWRNSVPSILRSERRSSDASSQMRRIRTAGWPMSVQGSKSGMTAGTMARAAFLQSEAGGAGNSAGDAGGLVARALPPPARGRGKMPALAQTLDDDAVIDAHALADLQPRLILLGQRLDRAVIHAQGHAVHLVGA